MKNIKLTWADLAKIYGMKTVEQILKQKGIL